MKKYRAMGTNSRLRFVNIKQAKAQNPQTKLRFGKTFKFVTLNARGLKQIGKREEIEVWMKENDIMILALQETRINTISKEARGSYTWHLSGENKQKEETYPAGVGFVIDNKFAKYT